MCTLCAHAAEPSIATLDAGARAEGNRKDIADRIGDAVFAREWPAQVLKIAADSVDDHIVVGLRVSGVKFHVPLSREGFIGEISALITQAFQESPVKEVDVWTVVPLNVGRGVIVNGDLAKPTSRTVFTISVQRGESAAEIAQRMHQGQDVYWDEDWVRTLVNKKG
jgi:hypothetical protein